MKIRKFLLLSPSAIAVTIFLTLGSSSAEADQRWNGSINEDWFNPGNWTSGSAYYRYIPSGSPTAVVSGGVANAGGVELSGGLTVDGAAGLAELHSSVAIRGGSLSIINGGLVAGSQLEVNDSGSVLVSGIHADGRRSTLDLADVIYSGRHSGIENVIRVEDGGLLETGHLHLPFHSFTFGRTHSAVIVSGVHESGVPSTVRVGSMALGRFASNTAEIRILEGGVFEVVDHGMLMPGSSILISGSSGPDHRSTLIHTGRGGVFGFTVRDGGLVTGSSNVWNAHVSGMDSWGNRSEVVAGQSFGGVFVVEDGALVTTSRLGCGSGWSMLRGTGPGSTAIHLATMRNEHYERGGLQVDGGTLVLLRDGSLSGDSAPVATMIGEGGMWVDTSRHVIVKGAWTQGPGDLHKIGSGTLELHGLNTHAATLVQEGGLILGGDNARLAGDVRVFEGAGLSGSGSIGGDLINLGTVSPGQSPGVLQIGGSFKQLATGTLTLEVGPPDRSDVMLVGGHASLGGTLELVNAGLDMEYGDELILLQAGSLTGSFSNLNTEGFGDVRVLLESDSDSLSMIIAPSSYVDVASNKNERSVAAALDRWIGDSTGDRGVVVGKLDRLRLEEYAPAFAAALPAWNHATDKVLTSLQRNQAYLLDKKLTSRRLTRDATASDVNDWDSWGFAHGMFSTEHSLGTLDGDVRSGGLMTGMDYKLDEKLLGGGFIGYGEGRADAAGANRSSVTNLATGIYATFEDRGFHGNAIVGAGLHDEEATRDIRFRGIRRVARSEGDGAGVFGSCSAGYSFSAGPFRFGPAAAVFADWTRFDSITESGAGALNLRVESRSAESVRSMVGVEASSEHKLDGGFVLVPETSLLWIHEFLNDADGLRSRLDGGSGPAFFYRPTGEGRNSCVLSTALNVMTPWGVAGNMGYHMRFDGDSGLDHTVTVGIDQAF